eukprot:2714861-Rhodomonas_salina.2
MDALRSRVETEADYHEMTVGRRRCQMFRNDGGSGQRKQGRRMKDEKAEAARNRKACTRTV